jgi:hypothetical protein
MNRVSPCRLGVPDEWIVRQRVAEPRAAQARGAQPKDVQAKRRS